VSPSVPPKADLRIPSPSPAAFRSEPLSSVACRLERCGHSVLRRAGRALCDGVRRWRGHLASRYLERIAIAAVAEFDDVPSIINRIQVLSRAVGASAHPILGAVCVARVGRGWTYASIDLRRPGCRRGGRP
jgi:hypothetical protein